MRVSVVFTRIDADCHAQPILNPALAHLGNMHVNPNHQPMPQSVKLTTSEVGRLDFTVQLSAGIAVLARRPCHPAGQS